MKRFRPWVLAAAVLAGGCSWFGSGDSNVEPPTPLQSLPSAAAVKNLWSRDLGSGSGKRQLRLQPFLDGGVLYASDADGRVTAIQADSGAVIWTRRLHAPVTGAVGVGQDLVAVGSAKGEVYALDKTSGELRWRASVSSEVVAPPAIGNGLVVVQSVDGRLAALAVGNGERRWLVERSEPALSLRGTSAPLLAGGVAFIGLAGGKLLAVQLRDGRVLWEAAVAVPQGRTEIERLVDVDVTPLIVGRVLYAASFQGRIAAFDLDSGRTLWSRDASVYTGLDTDGRNLYYADDRGDVVALDIGSGAVVWQQDKLRGRFPGAPIVVGDQVVVGDFDGYVHWLARSDGHFVARYRIDAAPAGAPAGDRGTLYIQSQKAELTALRLQS